MKKCPVLVWVLTLFFATFPQEALAKECVFSKQRKEYDLSSLTIAQGGRAYSYYDRASSVWWFFNVCGSVSQLYTSDESSLSGCGDDTSVCFFVVGQQEPVFKKAGSANNLTFDISKHGMILINHDGITCDSGNHVTMLSFECDVNTPSLLPISITSNLVCLTVITISSSLVCDIDINREIIITPDVFSVTTLLTSGAVAILLGVGCWIVALTACKMAKPKRNSPLKQSS